MRKPYPESAVGDSKKLVLMQAVFITIYTIYFSLTILQFFRKLNPNMKALLISFQVLMTARFINDIMLLYVFNLPTPMVYMLNFDIIYVHNRLSIILLYILLSYLKRAQLSIDPRFQDLQGVIEVLNK